MRLVLGVAGLLGLVLTIGLMAVLAVRVLDSSGSDVGVVESPLVTESAPVSPEPPSEGEAPAPGLAGVDAAGAAACQVQRATVETAANAFTVSEGRLPLDQQELVAVGLLSEALDTVQLDVSSGAVVVSSIGSCAGS